MTFELVDVIVRIVASVLLGASIGFERQWRARTAGIRTNALVALGSALFVIMGALAFDGTLADPTRVAAQVVSGIGFLGAGVIMKQGGSISGINTAATLWASAAVGALCGGGMLLVAGIGTAAVVAANMALRPVARLLDQRTGMARYEISGVEYTFEVRCRREDEVSVRDIVFTAVHRPTFTVRSITATDLPDGDVIIAAVVDTAVRDDSKLERAIASVIKAPAVLSVRWSAEKITPAD